MPSIKSAIYANIAGVLLIGSAAHAETTLSSGAAALSGQVNALNIVRAGAQVGAVSGSGTTAYDNRGAVAAVNEKVILADTRLVDAFQTFRTSALTSAAFSTGSQATGTTLINGLTTRLGTQAAPLNLELAGLTITARTLGSTSVAGADANGVYGYGSSIIEGLTIGGTLLGALTINGGLYANAAPNTVVLSLAGLTVTLNQQIRTQLTSGDYSVTTHALHIGFDNYLVNNILLPRNPLTGDVFLGSSTASVSGWVKPAGPIDPNPSGAVPEPAMWAMFIMGFGAIGVAVRRRGKTRATAVMAAPMA